MDNIDVRLRISSETKREAELVFNEIGMTLPEAIRVFLKQSINSGGLPFWPRLKKPNANTLQAFQEEKDGNYDETSLLEFKKSLNID